MPAAGKSSVLMLPRSSVDEGDPLIMVELLCETSVHL